MLCSVSHNELLCCSEAAVVNLVRASPRAFFSAGFRQAPQRQRETSLSPLHHHPSSFHLVTLASSTFHLAACFVSCIPLLYLFLSLPQARHRPSFLSFSRSSGSPSATFRAALSISLLCLLTISGPDRNSARHILFDFLLLGLYRRLDCFSILMP